jgi:hypothetical protein
MPARAHEPGFDPTTYPVEEKAGEDLLQRLIVELLRPLVERWLAERGVTALVGADQFIYSRQHEPTRRYAPAVYVLPGVAPGTSVGAWKIWLTGVAPSFALEVCSSDWKKDYEEVPERCAEIGVEELIVFDPWWAERPGGEGARWQVFRLGKRGLRRAIRVDDDRVRSKVLACWLRAVGVGQSTRIRIGTGRHGTLFPTPEEAERQAKEAERHAKEAERQANEAKEAALARVAELEALLRRR